MQDIEDLERNLMARVTAADDLAQLEAARLAALGRKGALSTMMRGLGQMEPARRREVAPALNQLKDKLGQAIEERRGALARAERQARLASQRIDVTLPVRPEPDGRLHPISQVMDEISEIFADMGASLRRRIPGPSEGRHQRHTRWWAECREQSPALHSAFRPGFGPASASKTGRESHPRRVVLSCLDADCCLRLRHCR